MIKKIVLFCFIAFASKGLLAQEKNTLKLGAIVWDYGIQYERSLSKRISVVAQVGYAAVDLRLKGIDFRSTGTGFYLGAKYYLSSKKKLMEGFYIGPYYHYLDTDKNEITSFIKDERFIVSSIGIAGGYQWIFDSHFTLEVMGGVGTLFIDGDVEDVEFKGSLRVLPLAGLTVGYNF